MNNTICHYIQNCHICRRTKAPKDQYNSLLKPLLILTYSWTDITLDFVTKLLHNNSYNAVLMIIDRLTKKNIIFHVL